MAEERAVAEDRGEQAGAAFVAGERRRERRDAGPIGRIVPALDARCRALRVAGFRQRGNIC